MKGHYDNIFNGKQGQGYFETRGRGPGGITHGGSVVPLQGGGQGVAGDGKKGSGFFNGISE